LSMMLMMDYAVYDVTRYYQERMDVR